MDIDDEALSRARHRPPAFELLVDRYSATLHAYPAGAARRPTTCFLRCG